VAAASAVADSLPFDKQTTKSELLRQLQQHEEELRAQKDREKRRIRSVGQKGSSVAWGPFHLGRRMAQRLFYIKSPRGPTRWHRRKRCLLPSLMTAYLQALRTEGENSLHEPSADLTYMRDHACAYTHVHPT
jgi:hypothetical protein